MVPDTTRLMNDLSQLIHAIETLSHLSEAKLRPTYAAIQALMAQSQGYLERATLAEQQLGHLLARIHGDGGHYQNTHGTAKAVADADAIIGTLRASD